MSLQPGTRVRRYEVLRLLGVGGMGEVYLARDTELRRDVALKILPRGDDVQDDDVRIHRFLQEAKTAISLSHPNIAHIYDVGEDSGTRFMAMEYVEGQTLRDRLARGHIDTDEGIEIATQMASAIASAHAAGIVHRDIKPENVMIRPDGYVKVLDFGLAKLGSRDADSGATVIKTAPGMVVGTTRYMSPEQLHGDVVDARSDVFSLGVVLYEILTGRRPFQGSANDVISAILKEEPKPMESVSADLSAVVSRALSKNPAKRFASAGEMTEALRKVRQTTDRVRSGDLPTQVTPAVRRSRNQTVLWIAAAIIVIAAAVAVPIAIRARRLGDARAALPRIEMLAAQRKYTEAFDLASAIRPVLTGDERLARAMSEIAVPINVTSDPPGATVYLERVRDDGETSARALLGTTPLDKVAVAKADYVISLEKSGYAPVARSISLVPIRFNGLILPSPQRPLHWTLAKASDVPAAMSLIPGDRKYRLESWSRPTSAALPLDAFLIDQFEVTNREFAEFVDQGGYQRKELWAKPFVKDGRSLSFDEAMLLLKDSTGLPAPRGWSGQKYPAGHEDYPVTGVTWYEAAAYAAFRGKSLPTLFQWDKTARDGQTSVVGTTYPWAVAPEGTNVERRANFRDAGPMPSRSLRGGMSPYGVYNLAGNVTEWCRNELDDGFAVTGGAYNEPVYQFGHIGPFPGFFSSANLGFRCARLVKPGGNEGAISIRTATAKPRITPVNDTEFAQFVKAYDYPSTPLRAQIVRRVDGEAWTLEEITLEGAGGQMTTAYLFLPKNRKPPYQVIDFVPASDVEKGRRPLLDAMKRHMTPIVRSGRAVFSIMLPGYLGRPAPVAVDTVNRASEEYAELIEGRVTDVRRGVDYLTTRADIDTTRIGFYGPSAGGSLGLIVCALEHRYRSVVFTGVGFFPEEENNNPKTLQTHFAPHIAMPKLMFNGRWDDTVPFTTNAQPLFDLFRQPKRLMVYDGGHVPSPEIYIPVLNHWFDETLGPVQ